MEKLQIVVLGRNYNSILGMVRAVKDLECEITVIKSVNKIPKYKNLKNIVKKAILGESVEFYSKYIKKYLYTVEPDRERLINLLLSEFHLYKNKIILMPTDDFTASTIDLYQEQLREKFLYSSILNKTGEIVKLMDKDIQKELAIKNGLNVAKEYVIMYKNNKYELPNKIIYPVFTKPQISFAGNKTLMKKCENEKELRDLLDFAIDKYNCPILVEQYIEIEKEYAILGCCYNGEIIIPGIIEKIKTGSGSHKGVTLLGKTVQFCEKDEIYNNLKNFMISTKFNGLFDIEIYKSNGKIYFNELNLRFGAFGYAITKSGVNLPKIFIKKMLGLEQEISNMKISDKKICINEKVALEELEAGYINYNEYKKLYRDVDFRFIKDIEDIKPYKIFKRKEKYIHIKNLIKGWRKSNV